MVYDNFMIGPMKLTEYVFEGVYPTLKVEEPLWALMLR
jgi:hypothetical protein